MLLHHLFFVLKMFSETNCSVLLSCHLRMFVSGVPQRYVTCFIALTGLEVCPMSSRAILACAG